MLLSYLSVWLAIFGAPWLEATSPLSLPSSPHGVLRVCVSVPVSVSNFSFFYKDTCQIGLEPTLMTSS